MFTFHLSPRTFVSGSLSRRSWAIAVIRTVGLLEFHDFKLTPTGDIIRLACSRNVTASSSLPDPEGKLLT